MSRSSTVTDRLARGLALLLALIAVICVTTAWLIQHHGEQRRAAVSDEVPPALTTSSSVHPAPASSSTRPTSKPAAPKPLVEPIAPNHLYIPAIGVDTVVTGKPTELAMDHFIGKVVPSFGVPNDMYSTAWWSSGPKPGALGMAVVLGHTQIGGFGVFNKLGKLRTGQIVGLKRGSHLLKFAVINVHTNVSKKDPNALSNLLDAHPAAARLALLTCSGTFNGNYRESEENTVVFARLVSAS